MMNDLWILSKIFKHSNIFWISRACLKKKGVFSDRFINGNILFPNTEAEKHFFTDRRAREPPGIYDCQKKTTFFSLPFFQSLTSWNVAHLHRPICLIKDPCIFYQYTRAFKYVTCQLFF